VIRAKEVEMWNGYKSTDKRRKVDKGANGFREREN
jgi:hypothetical protein